MQYHPSDAGSAPSYPPPCLAPYPFVPAILCRLDVGHAGDHAGQAYWSRPDDGAPTVKLPPITDTVRRRPPVPAVRELRGAELLRALADELDREDPPSSVTGDESTSAHVCAPEACWCEIGDVDGGDR